MLIIIYDFHKPKDISSCLTMPVQTRSRSRAITEEYYYNAPAPSDTQVDSDTQVHTLIGFRRYMSEIMNEIYKTEPGIKKITLINDMFTVIDKYFYNILLENKDSSPHWRLAQVIYEKTLEFRFFSDYEILNLNDTEKKFVEDFFELLKKVSSNLHKILSEYVWKPNLDRQLVFPVFGINLFNLCQK